MNEDVVNAQELSVRLDRLERENRRLKRIGGLALGSVGALALMSFAAPLCDTVWAERFVLRDASNKSRVTLNAYGTEQPSITFHDGRGKAIASLGVTASGAFTVEVMEDGRAQPGRFALDERGALALVKADANAPAKAGSSGASKSTGVN